MIIIFDLDDTLYQETDYVKSGLKAVDSFLTKSFALPPLYKNMLNDLNKNGRGKIFDNALKKYGLNTKKNISKCLAVYRAHKPDIRLSQEGAACLERFKEHRKYLVTDGNKIVQANKVKALGIENYFNKVFITRRYGIKNEKPSTYCFEKILSLENCKPSSAVYIGDNPNKDFIGIKPFGFRTVRVLQGNFQNLRLDKKHEAEFTVKSLAAITKSFINTLERSHNVAKS